MGEPYAATGDRPLDRPNWFAGRPVTAAGLDEQQQLFRERQRRHNRLLHGWGIVNGLGVSGRPGLTVEIDAGFALDAAGNELLVEAPLVVDLRAAGLEHAGQPHWLVVRWDEVPSGEPPPEIADVPEMTASWREDVEVAILDEPPVEAPADAVHAAAPWLTLATIVWDGDEKLEIDTTGQERLTPQAPGARGAAAVQVPVEP